jgi:hypothetical protein
MKVLKINENTMTVQVNGEATVITRRGPAACHINCGSAEVQRLIWSHLDTIADQPGELFDVPESIEARLTRVADLQHMDNQRLNSIAEGLEQVREDRTNEDDVHDLIAQYIISDTAGTLERKVLAIVSNALTWKSIS